MHLLLVTAPMQLLRVVAQRICVADSCVTSLMQMAPRSPLVSSSSKRGACATTVRMPGDYLDHVCSGLPLALANGRPEHT